MKKNDAGNYGSLAGIKLAPPALETRMTVTISPRETTNF